MLTTHKHSHFDGDKSRGPVKSVLHPTDRDRKKHTRTRTHTIQQLAQRRDMLPTIHQRTQVDDGYTNALLSWSQYLAIATHADYFRYYIEFAVGQCAA